MQCDIEEGRAAGCLTMEINDCEMLIKELGSAIDENLNKGCVIYGIDLSNSTLDNTELAKVVDFLLDKLKTISFLNLCQSQTDALEIENVTKKLPQLMGYLTKDFKWLLEQDIIFEMPSTYFYLKQ